MKNLIKKYPVVSFYLLTCLITWICWSPIAWGHYVLGWNSMSSNPLAFWLVFLGSFGPAAASMICTGVTAGWAGVKAHLKKLLRWRVPAAWWLVAIYAWVPVFFAVGFVLGKGKAEDFPTGLLNITINLIPSIAIIGPLGEELGWRGYALPKLLERHSALKSSLIIGMLWAFWHTPLALFLPDWRGGVPLAQFALNYVVLLLLLSVLFTWMYNKSRGSVLLMMVLHASYNYNAAGFVKVLRLDSVLPLTLNWTVTTVVMLIAIVLVLSSRMALASRARIMPDADPPHQH